MKLRDKITLGLVWAFAMGALGVFAVSLDQSLSDLSAFAGRPMG